MKKFFSALFFILYIIFIVAVFFGAMELAARHLRPQLIHPSRERERFCQYDPEIGWVNKPLASGRFKAQDFDVAVQINSKGMRDDEYETAKPSGTYRIAVMGDSFTWGYGVEAQETFSQRLESSLKNTQVLNFGCSGYGQDQELLLLKRQVLQYEPDLVIVNVHTASDFENNISFFQYGYYKPFFRPKTSSLIRENAPVPENPRGAAVNAWLSDRFVAWRLLGNRKIKDVNIASAVAAVLDGRQELVGKAAHNMPAIELTCRLCREIQSEASKAGTRVIFILNPNLSLPDAQGMNSLPAEDSFYAAFRACLEAYGMEFLDLRPVFESLLRQEPKKQITFTHDAHWNAEGHKAVAEAIREHLVSKRYVRAESPS